MNISSFLRTLRADSGMSQVAFAAWLGIPYRTYQDWERGVRVPPEWTAKLVAHYVKTAEKPTK